MTSRLLTVLANIKSACATGSKSPALPLEREDALVTAAVAQWLLSNADATLQVQSAPLLFGAIQQGLAHASTRMQIAVAVQLLALNEKLYGLAVYFRCVQFIASRTINRSADLC